MTPPDKNMPESSKKRYDWIDILKFLSIWGVYMMHSKAYGHAADTITISILEAFFFVSGFFFLKGCTEKFLPFVMKKFKQLMLPYYFFLLIYFIPMAYDTASRHPDLTKCILQGICAIRDKVFVAALWFLPCLFVLSIIVYILKKITDRIAGRFSLFLLLLLSIAAHAGASQLQQIFAKYIPQLPGVPFSVDWALYFMFYFILGAILFPKLKDLSFAENPPYVRRIFWIPGIAAMIFLFLGIAQHPAFWFYSQLTAQHTLYPLVIAIKSMILVYAMICLSKILENCKLFADMGRQTLLLCCTEQLSVLLLTTAVNLLGLKVNLYTPLAAWIWTFGCMYLSCKILIPFFSANFPLICGLPPEKGN